MEHKATEEVWRVHLPGFVQWRQPVTAHEGKKLPGDDADHPRENRPSRGPFGRQGTCLDRAARLCSPACGIPSQVALLLATTFSISGTVFSVVSRAASLSSWKAHLIFGDRQKDFLAKYGEIMGLDKRGWCFPGTYYLKPESFRSVIAKPLVFLCTRERDNRLHRQTSLRL